MAVTYSGTTGSLYINGQFYASGTQAIGVPDSGTFTLGQDGTGWTGAVFRSPLGVMWNRALTAAEIARLSENPWQIFQPIRRPVFYGAAEAGSDLNITGILGTATASSFTAAVDRQLAIAGSVGTATASGFTSKVDRQLAIAGSLGTATSSGFTATVELAGTLNIAGSLAVAAADGFNANIDRQLAIAASFGQSVADGFAATIDTSSTTLTAADLAAIDALIAARCSALPSAADIANAVWAKTLP